MSLQKLVSNYADYNAWANITLLDWLKTKPEKWTQEIPSSFSSILKTLNHIWATQEFWQEVIAGTNNFNGRYLSTQLDATEIFEGFPQQSQAFAEMVGRLPESELLEEVYLETPWVQGKLPRYEFIQHCLNHSTYHRGQIITIGRNLQMTDAPMTDYNYYNMMVLVGR